MKLRTDSANLIGDWIQERTGKSYRAISNTLEKVEDRNLALILDAVVNDHISQVVEEAFCLGFETSKDASKFIFE